MTCYSPLQGWKNPKNGAIVFRRPSGMPQVMEVSCGQCLGCRLKRSRDWALRCVHEASLHEKNSFITLTYAPNHLPASKSLVKRDFQLFMKRLRKKFSETKIRYFHCGEYGTKLGRPHYHAVIFGFDFHDKYIWRVHRKSKHYFSSTLTQIWGKGMCVIGDVTFESAAYVARYVMKKVNGKDASAYYDGKQPEYTTMSRRPGIAGDWIKKYLFDIYPKDFVTLKGKKYSPSRFYDRFLEKSYNEIYLAVKGVRKLALDKLKALGELEPDKLYAKFYIKSNSYKKLVRGLDDGFLINST